MNRKFGLVLLLSATALVSHAFAQSSNIEYSTDTRSLAKVCGHAPEATIDVPSSQVALNSRKELVTSYVIRTPIYSCENTQGDGKGGNWHGFYDQAGDKSAMLAAAIKGVGAKTAPYLVPAFQARKPRSWREFSDVITSSAGEMERKYQINPSWANNVLKQYKADNMRDLGYIGAADCRITGYNEERYEDRQFLEDSTVIVETQISGGKLLPGECEEYSVSWNGREVTGHSSSDENSYLIRTNYDALTADRVLNGRKAIVTFVGTRRAINPDYYIKPASSTAVASNGSVTVTLEHSMLQAAMQVPEFANACRLSATLVISGRKGSAWSSKKSAPLKAVSFPVDRLNATTTYIAEGVILPEGQHPVVAVSSGFAEGCPFYNTSTLKNGTIEN
ncbi:MAG: hypothetical protein H7301_15390 [Cryobacterium sp.]|nr:hypothetical protein [Oligoflexia bacterium]